MRGVWVSMACVLSCACASDGTRRGPNGGLDDDNGGRDRSDAGTASSMDTNTVDAAGGSSSEAVDASVGSDASASTSSKGHTSGRNPFHDLDAWTPPGAADAGSLILEPSDDPIDVASLCGGILELEGRVITTDLQGELTRGEWFALDAPKAADAGDDVAARDASVSVDAGTCSDKFAPYVVTCGPGVILVQSPSMAYGTGPVVGGEPVSMGCWQHECSTGCLPAAVEEVGAVRVVLNPIVPNATPEGEPAATGLVRINGVELEVLATLEVMQEVP